jgi:NAD(P)-dependent dehydrogenase (short-subunit alcohol dehydrogenase family)
VTTQDGHELTFQANHLAGFLLQALLSDLVVGTPGSRVIVTSSRANRRGHVDLDDPDGQHSRYRPQKAYGTSKLENILFVRELSRRLAGTAAVAMAVHPGSVATGFGAGSVFPGVFYRSRMNWMYLIGEDAGAAPLVWLATMPDPEKTNGLFFHRFKWRGKTAAQADDPALARGLWERSEEMVSAWVR